MIIVPKMFKYYKFLFYFCDKRYKMKIDICKQKQFQLKSSIITLLFRKKVDKSETKQRQRKDKMMNEAITAVQV